jgi:hypothetical protein
VVIEYIALLLANAVFSVNAVGYLAENYSGKIAEAMYFGSTPSEEAY